MNKASSPCSTLREILQEIPILSLPPDVDMQIRGITSDSRQVQPGYLFVAQVGGNTDGHRFIPSAIEHGVAAIVGTQPEEGLPVPYIQVADSRQALPYLAAAFYGFPARKLTMIGVTGTDGKTTTTNLIFRILEAAGLRAGMISTINAMIGDQVLDTGFHVTTPDAPDVQHYLAQMVEAGLTHAILETTSHGLAQHRVDACEFDVGVITNITHEHLDYHGSYEAYCAAKGRLFTSLAEKVEKKQGNPRLAVLNRDDGSYDYLVDLVKVDHVDYGFHPSADLRAEQVQHLPDGMRFLVCGDGICLPIESSLVGDFNVSNCLAALGATFIALGIEPEAAQKGIAALPGVPGRMERIKLGQDFIAIVDFAHTPNALRRALQSVRQMTRGRVIVVFGSAGLRDKEKRGMMAETSVQLADFTILTAEDPRTESLEFILSEMAIGAENGGGLERKNFWRVPDRGEALRYAVSLAQSGDVVIACGKGHEQSMCFGEIEYPWDDRLALRVAISERLCLPTEEMPALPTSSRLPPEDLQYLV